MAEYKVYFKASVEKDLRKIPQEYISKLLQRIKMLAFEPRSQGYEKLTGEERYRIRQGRYRILYSVQDNDLTIWVVKVAHRKDIYK